MGFEAFVKDFGTREATYQSCQKMWQPDVWEVQKMRLAATAALGCLVQAVGWRFGGRMPQGTVLINLATVGVCLLGAALPYVG